MFGAEKFAALAVKGLAVAGGFLAGYVAGGTVAWALDRWVFAHKTPDFVRKSIRLLAGVVVAVLVALVVFGDGTGGGLFGGGGATGDGTGKGGAADVPNKTNKPTPPDPKTPPAKIEPVPNPEIQADDVAIRVTFLGGDDAVNERYYAIDDKRMTFEELKDAITARKRATSQRVYLVLQFTEKNRVLDNSVNVTQVTEWAKNAHGIESLK